MKLRIASDEKGVLRVYEVDTGEELENIVDVSFYTEQEIFRDKSGAIISSVQTEPIEANIRIVDPEVDVTVNAEIEQEGEYIPGQSVKVKTHNSSSNVTREGIILHREKDAYEVYLKDTGAVEDFPETWLSPIPKKRPGAQS